MALARSSERKSFFAELKRRNVLRAVVLYIGAVWALAQGISQLAPALALPGWAPRAFLIACAVGFPFWTGFAWFYELTPEGFKRDSRIEQDPAARHSNARKLDFAIIGVLIIAVALPTTGYFIGGDSPISRTVAFDPPSDSIVVLPFANFGGDPKQQYFSNGITEELTGALGQNTGLTVIAWETASRFASGKQTPEEIGKALNVAHVLGGSIQREGDEVRVSVELVSTVSGRQQWAAHYDDSLKNIFALQDSITGSIANTLKVKFAGTQAAPTSNPQAHDLYLKGLALIDRQTTGDARDAEQYFQQALALDPDYADAWTGLANAYMQLQQYSTLPIKTAAVKIRAAAEKALALEPKNANALVVLGVADVFDGRNQQARADYQRALALDPNNVRAHLDYALVMPTEREALAQTLEAARLDPDNVTAQNNLAALYEDMHDWPNALLALKRVIHLSPHNVLAAFRLADVYSKMRQGGDAVKAFDLVQPSTDLDRRLLAAGKLSYQTILQPTLHPEALAALAELRNADLSPNDQENVIRLYMMLGDKDAALEMLAKECAANTWRCADIGDAAEFASLRGDRRFQKLAKQYPATKPQQ
ncbi:MAG: tetratricopeptide repeat protein [Rhodanobacteraceae bacterium]